MAVTLTLTMTNAEGLRVAAACGAKLGLRGPDGLQRDATEAECKQDLGRYIKGYVRAYETEAAAIAAAAAVGEINPT